MASAVLTGRVHLPALVCERAALEAVVEDARLARAQVWQAHLGVVHFVVAAVAGDAGGQREDLVQAGCLGLGEALVRYDPRRGVRFVTLAWDWVGRRVREEALRCGSSRPVWRRRTEVAVAATRARLVSVHHREVDAGEVAAEMGRPRRWVEERLAAGADVPLTEVSPAALPVEPTGARGELCERLEEALEALPRLEREVVCLHHGFEGRRVSLAEIGRRLGLPVRAVSRVERRALDRLRGLLDGEVGAEPLGWAC